MTSETLGRRNIAHGAEHRARLRPRNGFAICDLLRTPQRPGKPAALPFAAAPLHNENEPNAHRGYREGGRMSSYLQTVETVYAEAAAAPDQSLCCTDGGIWRFPDLRIPRIMEEMNYGCGSTVDPRDLRPDDTVLYVGVGGGLEALQFAYFTRRPGGVIAVDPVGPMRERARANFEEAARLNPWFRPEFVTLLDGNALSLPVKNGSATVVAQNCLFNVFMREDLARALAEVVRVLQFGGRF
jgi:hypothetical protein